MHVKHAISETTDRFEIGKSYEVSDEGKEYFLTDFVRARFDLWFVQPPLEILQMIGVVCTDKKRAQSVANMFDGNLNGFSYIAEANAPGSEEPLKWLLGALAAHMNEKNIPFSQINSVLPADYLNAFCAYLEQKKFDRTFAKDIFAELLSAERFFDVFGDGVMGSLVVYEHPTINEGRATFVGSNQIVVDVCTRIEADSEIETDRALSDEQIARGFMWLAARDDVGFFTTYRRSGEDILDAIISNPRFKAVDDSVIDQIIADVLAANPAQAEKAKSDTRVIQFFVGQVMKASKGKASAPVVQEKLRALLSI